MSTPASDERAAYLKRASAVRRGTGEEVDEPTADAEEATEAGDAADIELGEQRYVEMSAAEQFVLTVSERGFGKRTSSYEYRITGRGGKGIVAMEIWEEEGRHDPAQAEDRPAGRVVPGRGRRSDHAGHRRRQADPHPVDGIRIAGRSTQGVIVFNTADDEQVVSVERLSEDEAE